MKNVFFLLMQQLQHDMKAFHEMRRQGYKSDVYFLYGQEERCKLYSEMLKEEFGEAIKITCVFDQASLDRMTVNGSIAIAMNYLSFNGEE